MHLWLEIYIATAVFLAVANSISYGLKNKNSGNAEKEFKACVNVLMNSLFWPLIIVGFLLLSTIYLIIIAVRKCYSYFKK